MRYQIFILALLIFSCNTNPKEDAEQSTKETQLASNEKVETYELVLDSSLIDTLFVDEEELKIYYDGLDTVKYFSIFNSSLSESIFNDAYKLSIYDIDYSYEPSDDQLYYDSLFNRETDTSLRGDFMKLQLSKGESLYTFINLDGWIKIPENLRSGSEYFILKDIGLKYPVMILIGYTGYPQQLTIIAFDDEGPKVVFNKNRELVSVRESELLVTDEFDKYSRIYGLEDRILIHQNPASLN